MLKIGHRGAAGHAPENTLSSFKKALALRVDIIELDVHKCKTGELVVIHDETVDRTTKGKGKVTELTLEELKKLNIEPDEKIPTLKEVIDLVKGKCQLNVEVKNQKTAKEVAKLILENNLTDSSLISSNYRTALANIKKIDPRLKTAWVFWTTGTDFSQFFFNIFIFSLFPLVKRYILKKLETLQSNILILHYPFFTKNFAKKLKERNIKVFVWTVDKPKTIQKMKNLGVDGIFSDYPDRI